MCAPPDCRKVKSAKRKSTRRRASPLSPSPVSFRLAPSLPSRIRVVSLCGVCPVCLLCVFPALPGCLAQFFNSIFCISHASTGQGTTGTHGDGRAAGRGWNHHLNNSTFAACLDASRLSLSVSLSLSLSPPRLVVCLSAGCCARPRLPSTFPSFHLVLAAFHAPAAHRMTKIS